MKPKKPEDSPQEELFRNRLENLIDPRHELVRLAERIDWAVFDREWGCAVCGPEGCTGDSDAIDRGPSLPEAGVQVVR